MLIYKTISEYGIKAFNLLLEDHINIGWTLEGELLATYCGNSSNLMYTQMLVKRK